MKATNPKDKRELIGTLTFQDALNYGAILQCYALQQSIMKLGYETEVLNYASQVIRASNWPQKVGAAKSLREAVKILAKARYLKDRKSSFDTFKNDCLVLSDEFGADGFSHNAKRYAKVIVGSDQVWNPVLTHGDMHYFLEGAGAAMKKVSYAASVGLSDIPNPYAMKIRELLSGFCNITVREEKAAEALEKLTNTRPDVVCDPVMLLQPAEWEQLIENDALVEEPCVVYYALGLPNRKTLEMCRDYAGSKDMRLVVLHNSPAKLRGCISDNSCDPRQWLRYLKSAETIVTSSFHGACFALIFHRQLICVKSKQNGDVSSRITNLFQRFGLDERITGDFAEQLASRIDWDSVASTLTRERSKGIERLKRMLEL